jgi:uncharacterized caspase-like protein
LFRNGSLVRIWRGDLKPDAAGVVTVTASVRAIEGMNEFVAYGFNQDNVQSTKATLLLEGDHALARKGTAYLLVAGVNQYANSQFNLKYAAGDARMMAEEFARHLEQTGTFSEVKVISLFDADATKTKLLDALGGLKQALPEDAVFLFFAGHGWARDGQFYLIPHDLGYAGARTRLAADSAAQKRILEHAISDRELAGKIEAIDARLIALIIDACNAGQLLESEENRQGPFNSKGLAQLAWDKGMYVLTAAQSYQAALEASQLQHGYLTYALLEEGLKQRKADRDPADGLIEVREWFDYASGRVPEMQRERMSQSRILTLGKAQSRDVQIPRAFYRSELRSRFVISGEGEAPALNCSLETTMTANGSAGPATLDFRNGLTSGERRLYQLGADGQPVRRAGLQPGAKVRLDSASGLPWLVTDAQDECVAIYAPSERQESVTIWK